ncbi:GNAT family N-acetyltransferase [Flavimaribacter sediminis]|nr:GNAT family N-acetyltransferase [Flavimaribacter sediminis]
MRIRPATPRDEDDIRGCAEDAYRQYVAAIGRKPAPVVADFRAQIREGQIHIAEGVDGEILGFIVFFPRDGHMFLENVAVFGAAAGRGVGGALIAFCEAEAKRLRLPCVRLYTNEKMTQNLSIYPHLGYVETGRREEDGFARVFFEKHLA